MSHLQVLYLQEKEKRLISSSEYNEVMHES